MQVDARLYALKAKIAAWLKVDSALHCLRFVVFSPAQLHLSFIGQSQHPWSPNSPVRQGYNGGLFVVTLENVPTACGAWPAFWMFGDDAQHSWPRWGEYDILDPRLPWAVMFIYVYLVISCNPWHGCSGGHVMSCLMLKIRQLRNPSTCWITWPGSRSDALSM